MIRSWIKGDNIEEDLSSILIDFHWKGPVKAENLERLAYYKKFHSDFFLRFEKRLLSVMGLFYKVDSSDSLLEEIYSIYSKLIRMNTGRSFTPVQASVYNSIKENRYYSFSAPTSAGKSFLFREIIQEANGDIVIVVPSRALISEYYVEILDIVENDTLVLQFIEDVNRDLVRRRIFIVTPERGVQIFKYKEKFNVEMFLLDEAQLSEEEFRGLRFDAFVRRVDKVFPGAKKVFAHPFVENPEAQLQKHNFVYGSSSKSFRQQSVGKIFLHYDGTVFTHFSPNINSQELAMKGDIAEDVLTNEGTLLIYISKNKIYDGTYRIVFGKYVDMCPIIRDKRAIELINSLKEFIGAKEEGSGKHSNLIELMGRGVVTHHGSMPLKARLIVEQFIKEGWARICFATSTLNQGINMPFDVVWIDNFRNVRDLTLKNLIGRSGRTSKKFNKFDYGYTIVKKENVSSFCERYKQTYSLNPKSSLDFESSDIDEDSRDVVDAIKTDSFNDDLHLPDNQVSRITSGDIDADIAFILDNLLAGDKPIAGSAYYKLPNSVRSKIKQCFKTVYLVHLRRGNLEKAEAGVLSTAIPVLLWHIQGRSFSEMVSLRHSYLTQKSEQGKIKARLNDKQISHDEASKLWSGLRVKFSQVPSPLPNKRLSVQSSFPLEHVEKLDYDSLVYDTYDYLDKVLSYSLCDPICAVFEIYYRRHNDQRAKSLVNYIRYGTNDSAEIWLLKYGFGFEDIEWVKEYVESIDNSRIFFKKTIYDLPAERISVIKRYL